MRSSWFLAGWMCVAEAASAKPQCSVEPGAPGRPGRTIIVSGLSDGFPEALPSTRKGLRVTVVYRVRVVSATGAGEWGFVRGCRMTYDLWTERLAVTTLTGESLAPGSPRDAGREISWPTECSQIPWSFEGQGEGPGPLRVEIDAELNPISEDQRETTKRWLAERGIGGSGIVGRVLGIMVDVEARKIQHLNCSDR